MKQSFQSVVIWLCVAVMGLGLFVASPVNSQVITGDLVGTVLDKSGATVPNAKIVAINAETGLRHETTASSLGEYRISNLPVGNYSISATATNFATTTINGFHVELNKASNLPITLEVTSATMSIEVTGGAATVDTTSTTIDNTFEQKQLADLPNTGIGLGILNLSLMGAGVANAGALGSGSGPSIGGQRPRNNNFTVEGLDNNSKSVTGPLVPIPNDSVAEFTVLQNDYSVEFGHSSGGQLNFVLRSGTNTFHGLGYIYNQNRNFNAIDQSTTNSGFTSNQRFDSNRFGGNIGGPILKNKLFFFGSAQYNPVGQAAVPLSPICTPTANGYATLTALDSANKISHNNLAEFQRYMPTGPAVTASTACQSVPNYDPKNPTTTSNTTVAGAPVEVSTLPLAGANYNNALTWMTKIDYDISSKDRLNGAFMYNNYFYLDYTNATFPAFFLSQPGNVNRLITINEYHTFNTEMSNEFRFGYNRSYNALNAGNFKFAGLDSYPTLVFYDLNGVQLGPDNLAPQFTYQNVYQGNDAFTWVKGRHTMKFGFEGRKYISPQSFTQRARGDYEYNTLDLYMQDYTPDYLAERSLGDPVYYGDQVALYWFAMDSWRIRPNITLNYGVRYEYTTIPYGERSQKLNDAASVPGLVSFAEPKAPKNNWGPGVGIVYSPGSSGTTAIRAGGRIAYDVLYDNIGILSLPPQLSGTVDCLFANPPVAQGSLCPVASNAKGFLAGGGIPTSSGIVTYPDIASQRAATANQVFVNQLSPKAITWSLGVQHQFAKDFTAEVRYVGTVGIHLNVQERINRQPRINDKVFLPTFIQKPTQAELDALPYTKAGIAAGAYGNGNGYVPAYYNAGFNSTNLVSFRPDGHSTYNGLATQLTKHMSNGLQFVAAYTFSKTIDNSTADFFSTYLTPRRTQDFQNLPADRSNSALDHRHRFTLALIYDVPFYKHSDSWMKRNVLGNWQISPIYTYQTGEWMTVQSAIDANGNGDTAGDRSIFNPTGVSGTGSGVTALLNSSGGTVAYLVKNPNAQYFALGTYARATAGRNTLPGRSINDVDLSLLKRLTFGERYNLEMSMSAYNAFNHPQFVPGSLNDVNSYSYTTTRDFLTPSNGNFNNVESYFASNARTLQLGLKFIF
jgi:hypothetical protein